MKRQLSTMLILIVMISQLVAACAPSTPVPTNTPEPTATPAATFTPLPTSTKTPKPSPTSSPTATPNLTATAQVESMSALAKEYFDAGYISTSDGDFVHVDGYTDNWAQIGWYQWELIFPFSIESPSLSFDFTVTDFIIRTDVLWESASKAANPSGCGFVFRLQDNRDHYMAFISLDGYVYSGVTRSRDYKDMGHGYYGVAAQNGGANLTLVMEDNTYRVLVNDELIKTYTGLAGKMTTGMLAYTIVSGINTDFGTRCTFTNTDLWKIKK